MISHPRSQADDLASILRRLRNLEGPQRFSVDLSGLTVSESQVLNLVADLAGKADLGHGHDEADVTNLVADLAAKALSSHTHAESDITGLLAELRALAPPARPSGCVSESWNPADTPTTTFSSFTSGGLFMQRVWLWAGVQVSALTWRSGSTAMSGGSHAWAALFDKNRNLIAQSADDTTPTWPASSQKAFTLGTPHTPSTSDEFYVGVSATATTMPSLVVANSNGTAAADVAYVSGMSSSGSLAGTAPSTAGAITSNQPALVYCS